MGEGEVKYSIYGSKEGMVAGLSDTVRETGANPSGEAEGVPFGAGALAVYRRQHRVGPEVRAAESAVAVCDVSGGEGVC